MSLCEFDSFGTRSDCLTPTKAALSNGRKRKTSDLGSLDNNQIKNLYIYSGQTQPYDKGRHWASQDD